jgi:uncharacterized membrane protein
MFAGYEVKAQCPGPAPPDNYPSACYTDIQWDRGLNRPGVVPYVDQFVEYPALTGTFMWVTARLTNSQSEYLALTAVLLTAAAVGTALVLAGLTARRALAWALAPQLVMVGLLNWDILVVGSVTAAAWCWHRRRHGLAGLWLGIGAALKLYPALLIVPFLIDRLRDRDARGALRLLGGAALGAGLPNLPYLIASPHGWWATYRYHIKRPAEVNSIWAHGPPHMPTHTLNLVSGVLTAAGIAAVLLYGWRHARAGNRYPVLETAGAMLAVLFIFSKVVSPQYVLWLLPFFALLRVSTGWWIAFLAISTMMFAVAFMVGYPGLTPGRLDAAYDVMVWSRSALLALLAVAFLRAGPVADFGGLRRTPAD